MQSEEMKSFEFVNKKTVEAAKRWIVRWLEVYKAETELSFRQEFAKKRVGFWLNYLQENTKDKKDSAALIALYLDGRLLLHTAPSDLIAGWEN